MKVRYFIIILFLILSSCKKTENPPTSTTEMQFFIISGNNQFASAGDYLSNPVVIKLGSFSGGGIPNKIIAVNVIEGGGNVNEPVDTTDSDGLIKIRWQMGLVPGPQALKVSSQGIEDIKLEASAIAQPGKIDITSGNGQSAYPGDTLLSPIVITVKDSLNNPIEGRLIIDSVSSGGGKLIPIKEVTDANGEASFQWIAGPQTIDQHARFFAGTLNFAEATVSVKQLPSDQEVIVFNNAEIKYPSNQTITKTVSLPTSGYYSIEAELDLISPCNSCGDPECDPWDRIGYVTIDAKDQNGQTTTLDLIRFITPFGNSNIYIQDISEYSSLLTGEVKFNAYISTYVGHWNINFKLRFKKATLNNRNFMAMPLFVNNVMFPNKSDTSITVNIPKNSGVKLILYTTGHNNKGRNCDEFCQKVNKIFVYGNLIYEVTPWRTDCGNTALNKCGNPQSVKLSRAGWCPGNIVNPYIVDLGKLSEGPHIVRFNIANIEQNGGYWKVSLALASRK